MRHTLLENFVFLNVKFHKYHYTDCRSGSPLNYLAYMQKGHAKITSNDHTIYINEGDMFFISKNLSYQSYWYAEDTIDFLSCGFHSLHTCDKFSHQLQIIPCDTDTTSLLKQIFTESEILDCKALSSFYTVMHKVIPMLKENAKSKESVAAEQIKNCIRNSPYDSLKEIAQKCAMSEPYMYAVFRKATGITPNKYKQQILCEKGIELLLTTNKKIEEISALTNFSSSSYFRKILKQHTGSTPREIRKKNGF